MTNENQPEMRRRFDSAPSHRFSVDLIAEKKPVIHFSAVAKTQAPPPLRRRNVGYHLALFNSTRVKGCSNEQ